MVEDDLALLARPQHIDYCAVEYERGDTRRVRHTIVPRKISLAGKLDRIAQIRAEFARCPGAAALSFHGDIKARLIDAQSPLARNVGSEIRRKPKGIVQLENGLPR